MPAFLKLILTRSIVFYLACAFIVWRVVDYNQLLDNAVNQTMSRLTPPMDYFAEFVDKSGQYDRFKLMNCIVYHKEVAHYFPYQGAEAYGMMGFCYDRLGQQSQAVASYQKAIALNPDYFWPYFDLGVISYNQGQYAQAADHFTRAIEQDPVKTIVLLSRSKVYNDVNLSKQDGPTNYLQDLRQGRIAAYILMMDSFSKSGAYVPLLATSMSGLKEGLDNQGIFYYYAGVALFYQKSYQKAVEFLQIALQNDPQNAEALMYMGMCFKIAGKTEMAQMFISKAAQMHQLGGSALEQYLKPKVRFF